MVLGEFTERQDPPDDFDDEEEKFNAEGLGGEEIYWGEEQGGNKPTPPAQPPVKPVSPAVIAAQAAVQAGAKEAATGSVPHPGPATIRPVKGFIQDLGEWKKLMLWALDNGYDNGYHVQGNLQKAGFVAFKAGDYAGAVEALKAHNEDKKAEQKE